MAEASESAANTYPDWTELRKKNGLDPLGMQNSSVSLYQTLLPGISNVTLRMRYYGLYAWLCHTYAKRIGDTNPESWKRFVRRAEALYALIAYRHKNAGGVAGVEWAQKVIEASNSNTIEFAQAAEPGSETYYLKQAWGAYGAAYRSQLFEIRIFDKSETHDLPVPTPELGERLATVFEDSISERASLFYEVMQRGSVTLAELDTLSVLAPSEIALSGDERALYQKILLEPLNPADASARSRRETVLLIMSIAAFLGRDPKPEEVRWILFAGCDQQGRALSLGASALEAQRRLWWVYHANDLCHIAFETLLKFTLDTLGNHTAGISLARLLPLCVDSILAAAPATPHHWIGFLDSLTPEANSYAENANAEWSMAATIMKGAGRGDQSICSPETAWTAIRLLGILHKRVRDDGRDIATALGRFPDPFRSLLTETRFLDEHATLDFPDLVARLLEERVVQRHLWVALQKLRQGDYTFLIERDDGKLRLREKDGPVFTNPRLGPAITFLKDIHLVGGQGLTDYGKAAVNGA